MKNVWIVQDEHFDKVFVFSNPRKAYSKVIDLWKEQDCKKPSYSTFLKDIRSVLGYSNYFTVAYKEILL